MRRAALLLLIPAFLAACARTNDDDHGDRVAATAIVAAGSVVAVRAVDGLAALPEPAARHPSGSRVVRIDADGTETLLSKGFDAAGAPAVHHDGVRLLFVGRRAPDDLFSVFECEADGSGLRVVVDHGADCVRADYLPDGRVVYAATLAVPSPLAGVSHGAALFVAAGDGTPGARITFGAGLDTDPAVLSDGRIVFSSWRPGAERLGLFTVHPDGTGYAPFHLSEGHAVLPRQDVTGDVQFTQVDGSGAHPFVADWDAPMSVVTAADARDGLALAARPRSQGHLSSMREDRAYGTLVCVDARSNGGQTAERVRLRALGARRELGTLALQPDGSFMARVPVDTPLLIELLDAGGAVVAAEHGPFWVRNNEVRVCASCHDDIETGPPNARPAAVLLDPVDLTGGDQ